jgi:hypothetical protein
VNFARATLLAALTLALALAAPAAGAASAVADSGNFLVYQNDRPIGAESFSFEDHGDSLAIFAWVYRTGGTPDGQPFEKNLMMVVNTIDYGLHAFQSTQKYGGRQLIRGILADDAGFSVFREIDDRGEGDRLERPPGRLYIIDSQLFTLFDVICRNLYLKTFDRWPLTLFVLGPRDTLLEGEATDLGTETIRWGARPVQARKLAISDRTTRFVAWVSPVNGHMLRLVQAENGLRVERQPPAVKRRPPRPRPGK